MPIDFSNIYENISTYSKLYNSLCDYIFTHLLDRRENNLLIKPFIPEDNRCQLPSHRFSSTLTCSSMVSSRHRQRAYVALGADSKTTESGL